MIRIDCLKALQGMVEDSSTTRLADAEVGGRSTYVIEARPDFLQLDNHVFNRDSLASSYLGHPVLDKLVDDKELLFIPSRLRACAGPMVTEAIDYMAKKR